MITMTYGTIPDRKVFDDRFYTVTSSEIGLKFGNDERFGTYTASCEEVWKELHEAIETEAGLDWASCVMYVLGFEWI